MLRKVIERLRLLWKLALSERATPRQIGWAVALGAFIGCTPAIGLHGWIAVGSATLFRLNRLWSFMGSRIANVLTLPWIALAEVQIAHRLRVGVWAELDVHTVLDHAGELLLDWCLGTIPVGSVVGVILGASAHAFMRARTRAGQSGDQPPPSQGPS